VIRRFNRPARLATGVAVAAAVLVPAVLLTTGGDVSLTGVARAATKTQDAGSAKFVVSIQQAGRAAAGASGQLSGAIDFRTTRATMTFSASAGRMSGQMILDGTIWYVKTPALTGLGLGAGKQWVEIDLASSGRNGQQFLAILRLFDPARLFALLGTAGTFTAVGHETVGGVDTTHYSGSVDVAKFAAAIGAPRGESDHAPATFAADAWVDGQGYLRRLVFAFPALAGSPAATATVDFSDFGTAVDATPPPADQVVDLSSLGHAGFGGSGSGSGTVHLADLHPGTK